MDKYVYIMQIQCSHNTELNLDIKPYIKALETAKALQNCFIEQRKEEKEMDIGSFITLPRKAVSCANLCFECNLVFIQEPHRFYE